MAAAVVVVAGVCIRSERESTGRGDGANSSAQLADVSGAAWGSLSAPSRPAPIGASSVPPPAARVPDRPAEITLDNESRVDTAGRIVIPNPTPTGRSPAGIAPTPDELSALAASLVVPVAGVRPAELRGSFHAPRGDGSRKHNAIDIPAPRGTPVVAATGGRVLKLFSSKAGGLMIYAADATERFILMYGHLDRYADGITDGMRLERGQTIGYVGTTGNAPPNVPHLHFAVARTTNVKRWWNGTPIDPEPLLKR